VQIITFSSSGHDPPSTNLVVRVASKESLTISTPCQAHALWLTAFLAHIHVLWLQLVDLALLLQIENDNATSSCGAEPITVWREDQSMDLITSIERVKMLGLVKIPEHRSSVFATRGAKRAVRRDGHGVDVASVANMIGLDLAGGKFPDLDDLVPASTDDDRILWIWAESHAGNPFSMTFFGDGVLAVTESVPKLECSVARS